ncbi:hypothetical protein PGTUg99_025918 [Puccinia graminis f. sp. tritici]|uniref:Uncharacterized protein n=1 Tax=Puccinia graminis f. sp. tritici TaxID=56615 RepID=A0A5B0P5V6_PUCGR|nr:hypothetical protein PGTUg99_025918 [Puccinia graminis f. sp. tritici]
MHKLSSTLPSSCASDKDGYVSIYVPEDKSSDLKPSTQITPIPSATHSALLSPPILPSIPESPSLKTSIRNTRTDTTSTSSLPPSGLLPTKRFVYTWGPADQKAPKDISSKIDPSNIIEGSRQKNEALPDLNVVIDSEFPELNLTQSVTINEAMNDKDHLVDWDNALSS